ncbi:MAG TPA: dockerin type I domain-containing protein [Phycisphaerae bacterium]|nr:dockerin type I domain-containing protein [Phycisphaerae bacterium]
MKTLMLALALVAMVGLAQEAAATVFINEVFMNPPSSADDSREFIELFGTPGMKLDGYAVAVVNGGQRKIHPDSPIPPDCLDDPTLQSCIPEIDEFFSLDGLSLGANGLLVLGIGSASKYPTLLSDSNFRQWGTIWNGGLDTPGKLQNDGSNTILLIRHRPGQTQADPANPGGLRWGKDVAPDAEALFLDPPQPGLIQYGDGNLDKGTIDDLGRQTLDLKGASTLEDTSDDLEVVDEVSYEQDQGWEYDVDGRHVDGGSTLPGLPYRHVHALDDPQGFNPDCLTRVDYRAKGNGWAPTPGAIGELPNGNNWQDTATEQWIRGESRTASGAGSSPPYYYTNDANPNPDAIQPYNTNVPRWLADGQPPDFDFLTANSYQIMAGRINPLAVPFIPGDADRDGDCDADDIAMVRAVFGDDDWIFSNSFAEAPQGDSGDPTAQLRPWNVDMTGDNGIEASDLQWVLNFLGNANGRIIGRRYDSTTPSTTGVKLNSNVGVNCTAYAAATDLCGNSLNSVPIGDLIELTVTTAVTAGASTLEGEQNGIMQYVHDVAMSNAGVLRVVEVTPLGAFTTTRSTLMIPQGSNGDLGIRRVNGFTTSFTQGLTGTIPLYKVVLQAVGAGLTSITISSSAEPKFVASTPLGLKVGHTDSNGNPASVTYPPAIAVNVSATDNRKGDVNNDSRVDVNDLPGFVNVLLGHDSDPGRRARSDMNCDGSADGLDIQLFIEALLGQ